MRVLAIPFGWTSGHPFNGDVMLVYQDNILDRIAPENGPKKLSKERIAAIIEALEPLVPKR